MVFQTSALFNSLSVGENVGLWLREKRIFPEPRIRRIVRQKLRLVGLEGKESLQISELSGGMKKRVAIARSLAMNPDLIRITSYNVCYTKLLRDVTGSSSAVGSS